VIVPANAWRKTALLGLLISALWMINPEAAFAQSAGQANPPRSTTGETEMKAAAAVTTKVLAIGTWTAKATPEARTPVMPSEARDTLRLELRGKIDQWFAKSDGSGAVFLMNVTTVAEAHALLEQLPLGKAGMMTFELIPVGPLWPLGLLLREPAK
jgi:hypothetical protein